MLVLLPPSEGKTPPRRGRPLDLADLSAPELTGPRTTVLDALTRLCAQDLGRAAEVLGLGVTQGLEVTRDACLRQGPTARADRVYSGVLYESLGLADLDAAARRRATSWLAVTSGLFGLLRPADRIPAYRLAGHVTLPGVGPVSSFWSRHLEATVRDRAGSGLVVDLRSSAYVPFWRPDARLAPQVVSLRVVADRAGTRAVVSHLNKATKGRVVRALLSHGSAPRTPDALAAQLRDLGWVVEPSGRTRAGSRLDVVVDAHAL